jgi:hypothetical protein
MCYTTKDILAMKQIKNILGMRHARQRTPPWLQAAARA